MHISFWIPKAADTLRIYDTYCFSTAKMIVGMRLIACLVFLNFMKPFTVKDFLLKFLVITVIRIKTNAFWEFRGMRINEE